MGETTATTAGPEPVTFDVLVRPRVALVRSTALSIVFSAVPLAVALVWVSFPLRLWALVATVVVLLAVAAGVVFVRLRSAFVGISHDGVMVRGVLSPKRSVGRSCVERVVLATTFGSSVDRTTRVLVAYGPDDRHLFRMRSDVWGDAGLDRVVDALGVQVTELTRPLPARDFARRYLPTRSADRRKPC
ncbi:hypothetical protein [Curtobacterium sp. SL109]|uniref:hypothetical protein n=1 Tax=Curtobacterium sp. SL109 TaxID=2994662 RepID=UPI002272D222|nr:hypothetical protein [Curtobacterium sp. SL109]MCY1695964.1 hypothetical protein [Curtobacterium sp. SL109]